VDTDNITDAWAEKRKAEARAARRAALAPHQRQHLERQEREREARVVSKEHRKAQRDTQLAAEPHKTCNACSQSLPLSAFEVKDKAKGTLRGTCGDCRKAATAAQRRAERAALNDEEREKANAAIRDRYHRAKSGTARGPQRRKQWTRRDPGTAAAEAEEVVHLSSLLLGTHPSERLTTEGEWAAVTSKLHQLWLRSGDKVCTFCGRLVPPTAMLPPGPANFYPGKCQSCASTEALANHLRVTGRPFEGPRPIPMRDGTSITIAELARRHRERERERRLNRKSGWL